MLLHYVCFAYPGISYKIVVLATKQVTFSPTLHAVYVYRYFAFYSPSKKAIRKALADMIPLLRIFKESKS